jgi:CBS domain-containing protein
MDRFQLPVEEFTTPNPLTASEDILIDDLVDLMRVNEVRHIPIVRDGRAIGIVSERDLKVASGLNAHEKRMIRAADIMITDPVCVDSRLSLAETALTMSRGKIGSVLVNDQDGELLGIFTVTDALNALIEVSRLDDVTLNRDYETVPEKF